MCTREQFPGESRDESIYMHCRFHIKILFYVSKQKNAVISSFSRALSLIKDPENICTFRLMPIQCEFDAKNRTQPPAYPFSCSLFNFHFFPCRQWDFCCSSFCVLCVYYKMFWVETEKTHKNRSGWDDIAH